MTDNIVAFDFNGVKVLIDSNTVLKHLSESNSGATPVTLKDALTGADYQVPTGKKCTIIFFADYTAPGMGQDLITSTVADSTTGAVEILALEAAVITNKILILSSVAAELFITFNSTNASAHSVDLTAIEENA